MAKRAEALAGGPHREQLHIFVRRHREEADDEAAVLRRLGFKVSSPVHYEALSCDAWGKPLTMSGGAWIVIAEG
jgi:hypothetical protein